MVEEVFCHGKSDNYHLCGAYGSPCDGWFYESGASCPCEIHRNFSPVGEERTTPQTESPEDPGWGDEEDL